MTIKPQTTKLVRRIWLWMRIVGREFHCGPVSPSFAWEIARITWP
jgi:hypothetical protein